MTLKADTPLVHALHPSCNTGDRRRGCRADMIVLHYTGMSAADQAVRWLADPRSKVSCHYVVDERGHITQMVSESQRAWHAGASHWAGETDINSCSIGIEIQNPGHEHGYPDFPPDQMQAIAEALDLMRAYGYGIDNPGRDDWFAVLIRTFQMHFRPARADG
ncbi:MAG: N-acetylmuramoyl-L-alanine amidase, partial [Hyphomicrobium sp.]|nr:N-acetylmuramoyl-L-alanine amidase [Hyphomicrobium sp.]